MLSEPNSSSFQLHKSLQSQLSLSLHLPKEKAKEKKRQSKGPTKTHTEKHVFPKQAPRDGLDETVNPFSLSQFIKVSIFLLMGSLPFLFLILGPLCLLFSVGWWVITRWRWLMMECKSFMCTSMDPMRVNSPLFLSLLHVLKLFVNCFLWKKLGCYCGYVVINHILTLVALDLDLCGNNKIPIWNS